nr:FAD-dependent monooxygenase [Fodinicola feengrottensis]
MLICGGSIAGPTLAYWLHRHGFGPTVVERAPGLRPGGQAIDIRGTALEVVDRMGILDEARQAATHLAGMSFVDADGTEVMRSTEATLTGGVIDNPDVEIMRDDLTGLLYRQTKDTVEYVFDDTITALVEDDNGVTVTFEYTPARRFDLVIGADGLHSAVRALTFGPEKDFLTDLGTYLSVFSTPNFLGLEHWETFHRDGEKMGWLLHRPAELGSARHVRLPVRASRVRPAGHSPANAAGRGHFCGTPAGKRSGC